MTEPERQRPESTADSQNEVDDELSFHLEMRIREFVERGETAERARELAMKRFGEYEQSRRECIEISERRRRRVARTEYVAELRQDVRYALRMLRRTPGFALVAVATLALGIGANSTIFSLVRGVLLESLPYRNAERLYEIRTLYPDGTGYSLSPPDFMSVREDNRVFEQVEAFTGGVSTLLGAGEPREVAAARVSDGLFEQLGLTVALGRGFLPEEHQPGLARVCVLDRGFWEREFGADSSVLGRSVDLAGESYTIVGVLAAGARLPSGGRRPNLNEAQIYAPIEYDETFSATTPTGRRGEYLRVLARSRPGVTVQQVDTDMRRIGGRLQSEFAQTNATLTFDAMALHSVIVGDVRTPLLVLLGAVGLVLLVACANVANLVLARSSARQGEMAVRAALGAGRGRLLRQLLTESVVLGLAGGVAGLLIAYAGTKALVNAKPADIPRLDQIGVDSTVVLFTFGISLLTGPAFGAIAALQATGGRLVRSLREGGRGGGGHRIRGGLVVAEMALAVMLLTGAGLLVRSFIELTRVEPGFQSEQAVALRLSMQGADYSDQQVILNRVDALLEQLRALPGVTATAVTTVLPLSGRGSLLNFGVGGAPPPPGMNAEIGVVSVTADYFRAMGIRARKGRRFTDADRADSPPVAIINEAAARSWFAGEDPVGKRVTVGFDEPEIVGVVTDVLQRDPGAPAFPELYRPYAQRTTRSVRVVVRGTGDPIALAASLRAAVRALDANLPVAEITPLEQLVSAALARPRFYTSLLSLFALAGLALAAIGVFGVMSYTVAQRSREISIRMALGARASMVVSMIVGHAMMLAGLGAVIGMAATLAFGRALQSQLFGVKLLDPLTLVTVTAILCVSAAASSYLPARRAAGLHPAAALRET